MTDIEHKREYLRRAIDLSVDPQVVMDGRLDSELVIIGEGPGSQEVMKSLAFVGPTGELLWATLRQHGMLRPQFYVTNVCKRQISLAKDARDPVSPDEWTRWQLLLQWELEQLTNVHYILALGAAALQALTGHKGITDYRGSVMPWRDRAQVLYTFNPAAVLRSPENEITFQFDVRRFGQLIRGDWRPHPIDVAYDLSFADSMDAIRHYRSARLPIAVDLETPSRATACVGLANDPHFATSINFRSELENRFTPDEEHTLFVALQDLYEDPHVTIIAQNGGFDASWSGVWDHVHMPVRYDTLLAHHTLYPQLPHSLQYLVSMYTTMPYYKGEYDDWREGTAPISTLWTYNGKDAAGTVAAYQGTKRELIKQGLYDFFTEHVMRLQPHLVRSTIDGIRVDTNVRSQVNADLLADVEAGLARFHHVVHVATGLEDYTPNPLSHPQMRVLLYDKLRLKHRSGSTDETARTAMLRDPRTNTPAKNVLAELNRYKTDQKFASTYTDVMLDHDGRMRCDWKQYGVQSAPGRLSSAATLWGVGMNMQNQPPKARRFYVADEGCVLIYYDLAQAEARVVAVVADIEKWKADFERARLDGSYDCHRALAADMFKVPYDDVPTKDEVDGTYTMRYIAKRCRHALNYRMEIAHLAEVTGLSHSSAAQAYHTYHRLTPELRKWWTATERVVRQDRELWNAYGRRWRVLQRLDDEALKSIIAFYPQSTIGDKNSMVWYQCHEDQRWDMHKARIRLNVHDSLIGVSTPDFALRALSIMRGYAEQPITIQNVYRTKTEQLIIPAETKMSTLTLRDGSIDTHHRWSNLVPVHVDAA